VRAAAPEPANAGIRADPVDRPAPPEVLSGPAVRTGPVPAAQARARGHEPDRHVRPPVPADLVVPIVRGRIGQIVPVARIVQTVHPVRIARIDRVGRLAPVGPALLARPGPAARVATAVPELMVGTRSRGGAVRADPPVLPGPEAPNEDAPIREVPLGTAALPVPPWSARAGGVWPVVGPVPSATA
jgi:hypothetical protein